VLEFHSRVLILKPVLSALLLLLVTACVRHGAEQLLLDQFFNASRLRDRTALQKISTVILEPLEQGAVTTFTITDVVVLEAPNGVVESKQVNVSAPVRLPDGRTVQKNLNVILQRGDRQPAGAWMVTGIVVR
jgi:hypothetical protein